MRTEESGFSTPRPGHAYGDPGVRPGFGRRVLRVLRFAGKQLIHKALLLYYAAQNPRTPKWAKTAIYGALAYFVLPLDAVPDLLPGIGYGDDLWVLAAAVATVSFYIDETVRARAARNVQSWFGAEAIQP